MLVLADLRRVPRQVLSPSGLEDFAAACQTLGLDWPLGAIEQFLYDHGTNDTFLDQYEHLDLLQLKWELSALSARELIGCTYHRDFSRVSEVARHPRWTLDLYTEVHGKNVWNGTWIVPPLVIDGSLRNPPQRHLHLMEGHTRLGG